MNYLPPPLEIILLVRTELACGKSLTSALHQSLQDRKDEFSRGLRQWLLRMEAGQSSETIQKHLPQMAQSPARKSLLAVFARGIQGSPVDAILEQLEGEFLFLAENAYDRQLQILPLKLMIPLLLFILPGVMLILIGPVIWILFQAL